MIGTLTRSYMDAIRQGQIALLVVRQQLREIGIGKAVALKANDIAEAIGVPVWEVLEFLEDTVRELLKEKSPESNECDSDGSYKEHNLFTI